MSARDELIAAYGARVEKFEQNGEAYHLRRLMGDEGAELLRGDMPADEMAFAVLYFSLCDSDGSLLFEDSDDVKRNLSVGFIAKASQEAMRFNGLLGDEAGKSEETPVGGSPSG